MKLYFNVGARMLLFKIRDLDKQIGVRKLGRLKYYQNFVSKMILAFKAESESTLKNVASAPVGESYKKFKMKKL